ncbi:restriction endonuclease subunit S [Bacillus salacetis]|uniref:restriction endonuclease subunit S n=1 Tax=Bacillus salacetis TaxID=2315464 RepID=UPI003BA1A397
MVLNEFQNSADINWYERVPEDWSEKKLKYLVETIKGYAFKSQLFGDKGVPIIKTTDIKNGKIQDSDIFIDERFEHEYKNVRVKKNDILMSTVGSKVEVTNSAVGQIGKVQKKYEGALLNQNAVILRCKSKDITNNFLFYFLNSHSYRKYLDLFAHGTANQASLSLKDILDFKMPLPSRKIQNQISEFLEHKTSDVETLIGDKQKLIDLLEEKRQAIITEAVTKGLNPDVKYKNSGVQWIGEVPEHWEITKLKRCLKVLNGKEIKNEISIEEPIGVDVYGSGGVFKKTDEFLYEGKSVLFGRKGTIGKPIFVEGRFWAVDTMYFTKFYKGMNSKWFYYMFIVFPWDVYMTQTALPSIVGTDIENEIWAVPKVQEQQDIVKYLDTKISDIDKLILEIKQQIEKLKEYRQSLIYEAVTGKIDVRDYQKVTN